MLLVEGYGFNVGREAVIIAVKDIANCMTGFSNSLALLTNSNENINLQLMAKGSWESLMKSLY